MQYIELAKGEKVPVLGLGTWGLGGMHTADHVDDEKAITAIRTAIDLGLTHIDTAAYYGAGHTEELIGKAIEPYNRKDLFITTKVYKANLRYPQVLASIKESLKRMNISYVDLFLVHWPNPSIPLEETMTAMEHCVDEGFTRFIGVSNFSFSLLREAQSKMKNHRIVADQVYYNVMHAHKPYFGNLSVEDLYPYCRNTDITLIAWAPLEQGKLTQPGFPVLDELARKYGKTQAQVSLNWLISKEKIVAIPKASSINHMKENLGALGWKLSEEDSERLQESFLFC